MFFFLLEIIDCVFSFRFRFHTWSMICFTALVTRASFLDQQMYDIVCMANVQDTPSLTLIEGLLQKLITPRKFLTIVVVTYLPDPSDHCSSCSDRHRYKGVLTYGSSSTALSLSKCTTIVRRMETQCDIL